MNETHDLNEFQAIRELAKGISGASKKAEERGQPFVLPWRLDPNAAQSPWQEVGDASCGCGPVD